MKYRSYTVLEDIQNRYDHIIAWGGGSLLFVNYWPTFFHAEFILDGSGKDVGTTFRGAEIKSAKTLENIEGKCLIVIYTIYEQQVLHQLKQYTGEADTIIFPLLRTEKDDMFFSLAKNGEDLLLIILLKYLGIRNLVYLEIGVCHPVMRNNTYRLRKHIEMLGGTCTGVLAEANPLWWDLIEEYRPYDKLLKCGIGSEDKTKSLYIFPDLLGHTTFVQSQAMEKMHAGIECREQTIEVASINSVLDSSFERVPDLLALDAEGMDFAILDAWDHELYPIKIVVAELGGDEENQILSLMDEKGYSLYARTLENGIWIRKDEMMHKLMPQM